MNRACKIFSSVSDFRFHHFPESLAEDLWDAVARRAYPALYACLRKMHRTFSPAFAYSVCSLALDCRLTLRAFTALLDHCPPLEDFLYGFYESILLGAYCGLVEKAAALDRADVLDLLLSRGPALTDAPSMTSRPSKPPCPHSPTTASTASPAAPTWNPSGPNAS
ncbi:MAG: hypothetical protein HFF90_07265 [Oscillibacter sp.]|nr:hypothetical protein [Oscillibacter sp.]